MITPYPVKLAMIAAIAEHRVIGVNNQMPWHLPADFKWFRQHTLGKTVVMGRKTYLSIGKALPQRRNIVLSQQTDLHLPDADVFLSLEAFLQTVEASSPVSHESSEVMLIGGGQIYQHYLPYIDRLYLTLVDAKLDGDCFFPDYQIYQWQEVYRQSYQADEKHAYDYTFLILDRIAPVQK